MTFTFPAIPPDDRFLLDQPMDSRENVRGRYRRMAALERASAVYTDLPPARRALALSFAASLERLASDPEAFECAAEWPRREA